MDEYLQKLAPPLRSIIEAIRQGDTAWFQALVAHHREAESRENLRVLVKLSGDPASLESLGLDVTMTSGPHVGLRVPASRLAEIAAHPSVLFVDCDYQIGMLLDSSVPETRADRVRTRTSAGTWSGLTGKGVVVGIIDTGIDFQHGAFLDGDGKSRILFLWDQGLKPESGESVPTVAGSGRYGVEYTKAQIDSALASSNPGAAVRQKDERGHGTHVAGIAAGDGSEDDVCSEPFEYVGVAIEADLIVVKLRKGERRVGDIVNGVEYVFERAGPRKAAVANLSWGLYEGPRDGTGPEDRLSTLLNRQAARRVLVVAAGNEADKRTHAAASVSGGGGTVDLEFLIPPRQDTLRSLELWYDPPGKLKASLVAPDGVTATRATDDSKPVDIASQSHPDGTTRIMLQSQIGAPQNGNNTIFAELSSIGGTVSSGTWKLRLRNDSPHEVEFDAWISKDWRNPWTWAQFTNDQLISESNYPVGVRVPFGRHCGSQLSPRLAPQRHARVELKPGGDSRRSR